MPLSADNWRTRHKRSMKMCYLHLSRKRSIVISQTVMFGPSQSRQRSSGLGRCSAYEGPFGGPMTPNGICLNFLLAPEHLGLSTAHRRLRRRPNVSFGRRIPLQLGYVRFSEPEINTPTYNRCRSTQTVGKHQLPRNTRPQLAEPSPVNSLALHPRETPPPSLLPDILADPGLHQRRRQHLIPNLAPSSAADDREPPEFAL